jgi:hypothetical protein
MGKPIEIHDLGIEPLERLLVPLVAAGASGEGAATRPAEPARDGRGEGDDPDVRT